MWTVGPPMYAVLVSSEFLGKTNSVSLLEAARRQRVTHANG